MTNEKKKLSEKQLLQRRKAALKTGEHSKYFSPKVVEFMQNPAMIGKMIQEAAEALKQEDLPARERIAYLNALVNIGKYLHGTKQQVESKNINANIDLNDKLKVLLEAIRKGEGLSSREREIIAGN